MKVTPADRLIDQVIAKFNRPYTQGLLLLLMVVIAMTWANSPYYESYHHFFERPFTIGFTNGGITESLHVWINDALMAIFFFTVGLEIKREVMEGELSTPKKAALPIVAALGGMVIPASIFLLFNYGTSAQDAWGIPMATDIAFAIGLMSLLGRSVSGRVKVYLTALATVDDLGAIIVIAIFLSGGINVEGLIASAIWLSLMLSANYFGVRNMWFYIIVGIFGLWVAVFSSGLHATIAGVLGALTIPATRKITEQEFKVHLKSWSERFVIYNRSSHDLLTKRQDRIIARIARDLKRAGTPLQRVERKLTPFVNYFVLPLFALANAGVHIEGNFVEMLTHPVSIGILAGLVVGKVVGIFSFSYLSVKLGFGTKPEQTGWNQVLGLGFFAGIGFTMSLFIAELALQDEQLLTYAKLAIITASMISAIFGLVWFKVLKTVK
jgi:NhaA family Na+:H+ antiporter